MTRIPDGIPAALKLSTAAKVLNLDERTLRGWADRKKLATVQFDHGTMRFVTSPEVARVAEKFGIIPNWESAL